MVQYMIIVLLEKKMKKKKNSFGAGSSPNLPALNEISSGRKEKIENIYGELGWGVSPVARDFVSLSSDQNSVFL